jgi:hypothetical protein
MEPPDYKLRDGEEIRDWLIRLIGMGAPKDIRENVQALLQVEAAKTARAGNPLLRQFYLLLCLIIGLYVV